MALPISARQMELLNAFAAFQRRHGRTPSVRDLARRLQRAPSTVHQTLVALQRKGLLVNEGGAHGWRLVEEFLPPEESADVAAEATTGSEEVVEVPIRGRIAAGRPIEAVEDVEETLPMPRERVREGTFALRVEGDSMIEDHIVDGDLVLVEPCDTVRDGEIAVALLEDGSATLKRVYRERDRIRLQPANERLDPLFVDQVRIQGRAVGVVRLW